MMLIDCPFCGPRAELEFTCGGESHIARPADQAAMSDAAWADYLFMRKNPKGLHYERWNHARGCRRWFNVARDTVTHRISQGLQDGRAAVSEQSASQPPGRPHRPQPAARLHLRRQALSKAIAGDTLASALLANGVHLVGRSFKYHRPRGIMTAGAEEPNALIQLRSGRSHRAQHPRHPDRALRRAGRREPEPLAVAAFRHRQREQSAVALFPGGLLLQDLHVAAQRLDEYTSISSAAPPASARRPEAPDPDRYSKTYAHCDVLVVGAGPAGIVAALAAGAAGARVILADEQAELGGSLLSSGEPVDGKPAGDWLAEAVAAACRACRR